MFSVNHHPYHIRRRLWGFPSLGEVDGILVEIPQAHLAERAPRAVADGVPGMTEGDGDGLGHARREHIYTKQK